MTISNKYLTAVASEFYPPETPIAFTNHGLYLFLKKLRFEWLDSAMLPNSDQAKFKKDYLYFSIYNKNNRIKKNDLKILKTIFEAYSIEQVNLSITTRKKICFQINSNLGVSPYKFYSLDNKLKRREFHLVHPGAVIISSRFIYEFRHSIIYHTNISNYSIRYPIAVTPGKRNIRDAEGYKHLKNYERYFKYNKSGVFTFDNYSPQYLEMEKKFEYLTKFDISNFFASIYTHSFSWATNGWETSKLTFSDNSKKHNLVATFGHAFDTLMQCINHKETNGIVVGPELSRIFAEIILQRIDLNIENRLKQKHNLIHGEHYKIYRYADDYRVFTKNTKDLEKIKYIIETELSRYKLFLNTGKESTLEFPMLEEYMRTKNSIYKSIGSHFSDSTNIKFQPSLLEHVKDLLLTYPNAVSTSSFIFSGIEKNASKFFSKVEISKFSIAQEINALLAVLDALLYTYGINSSNENSEKIAKFLSENYERLKSTRENEFNYVHKSYLRNKVCEKIESYLKNNNDKSIFGTHTLNLIDILTYFDYTLSPAIFDRIISQRGEGMNDLDCFSILVLIRHFMNKEQLNINPEYRIIKKDFKKRISHIISNATHPHYMTQAAILKSTLYFRGNRIILREENPFFDWGVSSRYKQTLDINKMSRYNGY